MLLLLLLLLLLCCLVDVLSVDIVGVRKSLTIGVSGHLGRYFLSCAKKNHQAVVVVSEAEVGAEVLKKSWPLKSVYRARLGIVAFQNYQAVDVVNVAKSCIGSKKYQKINGIMIYIL